MASVVILASASPRRAAILEALGVPFRAVVPDIDETLREGEGAREAAERLACEKVKAVLSREHLPVLGADTLVVVGDKVLGKPTTHDDAALMLRSLSGREHEVVTGVCLAVGARLFSGVESTRVAFAPMSDAEIAWYVSTREPMDKAGGYHVDGLGAAFIQGVTGSPSNVAGLPVRLVLRLAREAGVPLGPP